MTNRLLELERELARRRGPSARAKSIHIPGRPRAFAAPVDFRVSGVVPPIAQPTSMTCWATVATIMHGWRHQRSDPIENVLRDIGPAWLARFRGNQGLAAADKEPFLTAAGMTWLEPQNPTVAEWERLLRANGPLWVTTDEQAGPGFAIHARVMAGIHGDGTLAGTSVDIVDPAGGREYSEPLAT
ncbi:MAG TPA: papain-like cysteine protease family protein, partial [Longimicrobium sp.]